MVERRNERTVDSGPSWAEDSGELPSQSALVDQVFLKKKMPWFYGARQSFNWMDTKLHGISFWECLYGSRVNYGSSSGMATGPDLRFPTGNSSIRGQGW
jgi:hypothetical protein